MGSWFQKPKQYSENLLVATLNYGGIINGPFEFFSGNSEDEQKLSDIFHKLMPLYTDLIGKFSLPEKGDVVVKEMNEKKDKEEKGKDVFKWNIGKIDQKAQIERYTPVYNKGVGVQNGKLITQQKFLSKWEKEGQQWNKESTFKQNEMNVMKGFDLIAYHAILKFVYDQEISDEIRLKDQKKVENLSSSKYINFMEQCFSRDYLDEDKKIERLIYVLKKNFHSDLLDKEETMSGTKMIDVLFIQEPSKKLLQRIKKENIFHVQGGLESVVIIVRKSQKFKEFYGLNNRDHKKIKDLQLEEWPIFKTKEKQDKDKEFTNPKLFAIPQTNLLVCNNFLFIGLHLSSKSEINKPHCQILKKQLNYLNKFQNEYEIIAAGDINSYLDNKSIENYKVYPANPRWLTTNKKRTYMQAQYKKANEKVSECKDHIITNANMVKSGVMTIEIEVATDQFLLPTSKHPFDHFMVVTLIKKRLFKQKNDGQNQQSTNNKQESETKKDYHRPLQIVN